MPSYVVLRDKDLPDRPAGRVLHAGMAVAFLRKLGYHVDYTSESDSFTTDRPIDRADKPSLRTLVGHPYRIDEQR